MPGSFRSPGARFEGGKRGIYVGKSIVIRAAQTILLLGLELLLLFFAAGTCNWPWARILTLIYVLILVVNAFVLPREVMAERGGPKENAKDWDRVLIKINAVPALGAYVLAGLDFRWSWSPILPAIIHILGFIILLLGAWLFAWSMTANTFFSTVVRIQEERGHRVVSAGPYRFVRHPGYVGLSLMTLGMPLALGSLAALGAALLSNGVLVVRTHLEDCTLRLELDGYEQYAEKVKYRLIPYLW